MPGYKQIGSKIHRSTLTKWLRSPSQSCRCGSHSFANIVSGDKNFPTSAVPIPADATPDPNLVSTANTLLPIVSRLRGRQASTPTASVSILEISYQAFIDQQLTNELPDIRWHARQQFYSSIGVIPAGTDLKQTTRDFLVSKTESVSLLFSDSCER
jgi:hypothetical protein